MRKYAIFYGDGTIVEGGGPDDEWVEVKLRIPRIWRDAPSDNVQAVVIEDIHSGRTVWRNNDFYYWVPDGEACSTDVIGEYERGYVPAVKFGLCLTQEQYDELARSIRDYDRIPRNGPQEPQIEVD